MDLKKVIAALVLIAICIFGLYADTYTVIEYRYKIDGITTQYAIENLIKPKGEEVYQDVDALQAAVDSKKQQLWNTALFDSAKVTYSIASSVDGNSSVIIDVEVVDADSSIIFPYPKYDSNYGFVFGIRFKEKNLFGLMASMDVSVDIEQQEKSYRHGKYYFDVPITGLTIKDIDISAEFLGNIDLLNKNQSYLKLILKETGWKVGSATINTSLNLDYHYGDNTQSRYTFSLSESGLEVGPGKLNLGFDIDYKPTTDPKINKWSLNAGYTDIALGFAKLSASFNGLYYPVNPSPYMGSESYHKFSFSLSDIKIGGFTVSETPVFTFQPAQNSMISSRFYSLDNTVTVGMPDGTITGKKLSNNVYWEIYRSKTSGEKYNYIKTNSSFSFNMLDGYTDSVIFKTWRNDDKSLYRFDFDLRVEKTFGFLDGKLNVSPIVTMYNSFNRVENKFNYSPYFELAFSAGLTGGEINRIDSGEDFFAFRDNFRYGTQYTLQAAGRYILGKSKAQFFIRGEVVSFPLKNHFFNPSIRLLGMAQPGLSHYWFNKGSSDTYKISSEADGDFYYSYNAYSYNEYLFGSSNLGEILRGILNNNPAVKSGGYSAKAVLAGNINLTTALFNFEEMGHTYLSPFYDFVLFFGEGKVKGLHSLGIEGVAILDSHPAYPIRVSLGFNADDVIKRLQGEKVTIEYELFIGMGWMF